MKIILRWKAAIAVMTIGAGAAFAADVPYTVVDGYKVDAATLRGYQAWKAAACDRCHGPGQEGMVGPSLLESLKVLTRTEFVKTVTEGRLDRGMPSFKDHWQVAKHIDGLYAYLKGRSDGAITQPGVQPIAP
jgi:mono/diheme cytochrome c family protein